MKEELKILTLVILSILLTSCTKQFPQAEHEQAYDQLISENYTQATAKFARLSS